MTNKNGYDVVIVGGGHNGLVAACYLALAGQRVLILEKNDYIGGATRSNYPFPGVDARLSVYSYLVSLLPGKILSDLGIRLEIRQRAVASYSPLERDGKPGGLLISNIDEAATRASFHHLTGSDREYAGYRQFYHLVGLFAHKVWPTLLSPLIHKDELEKQFQLPDERRAWAGLVEQPLGFFIEECLADDLVRGTVFTDGKIGVPTCPEDPTLLQNRTFLYHAIGQGTGEWRVPVGGMGTLVDALVARAQQALGVEMRTLAVVTSVQPGQPVSTVYFQREGKEQAVSARTVLFNTSSDIANRILPGVFVEEQVEGSVFKINMVLKRLPRLKDGQTSAREVFTGTFHFNEGYDNMRRSSDSASSGPLETIPGEMYCHSLTDPSILSADLQARGWQTLTLFGLDVPYRWFVDDNEGMKARLTSAYLRAINQFCLDDIEDCLAQDADGRPCLEAKSPLDLERSLGLPKGNIFHGNLTWPFAERKEEAGAWGVETNYPNVYICGSSARRGGAVSGIPGHNAAMKVLNTLSTAGLAAGSAQ
jgi:phytoene dehydrogenase-like protein